jgi:beta-galactosidase
MKRINLFFLKSIFIDHSDNPVGCYVCDFNLLDAWDGRRVFLHFESGLTATTE